MTSQIETATPQDLDLDTLDLVVGGADAVLSCRKAGGDQTAIVSPRDPASIIAI